MIIYLCKLEDGEVCINCNSEECEFREAEELENEDKNLPLRRKKYNKKVVKRNGREEDKSC